MTARFKSNHAAGTMKSRFFLSRFFFRQLAVDCDSRYNCVICRHRSGRLKTAVFPAIRTRYPIRGQSPPDGQIRPVFRGFWNHGDPVKGSDRRDNARIRSKLPASYRRIRPAAARRKGDPVKGSPPNGQRSDHGDNTRRSGSCSGFPNHSKTARRSAARQWPRSRPQPGSYTPSGDNRRQNHRQTVSSSRRSATGATIGDRSDPSGITAATMTARIETRPPRPFRQSFGIQRRKNRFPPS